MMNLRLIAARRVAGIVVPFTSAKNDAYGTFWDARTDFGIAPHVFPARPIFLRHGLRRGEMAQPIGLLDPESFAIRADGVYAEGDLQENKHNARAFASALELLQSQLARWSSGVLSYQAALRQDGYYERWPIAEASIVHQNEAGDRSGITQANLRMALDLPEIESNDTLLLESPIILKGSEMPPETTVPTVVPVPVVPVVDNSAAILQELQAMNARLAAIEALPPVQLPVTDPLNNPHIQQQIPTARVSSPYDNISLLGMVFWKEARDVEAFQRRKKITLDEPFMRALLDKMNEAMKEDERRVEAFRAAPGLQFRQALPYRSIDNDAVNDWRKYVPNLRANEAMGSTLAGFGDELVPTLLNSVAYWYFMNQSRIMGLFENFDMPSDSFDYPVITSLPRFNKVLEALDQANWVLTSGGAFGTAKQFGTSKVTFDANKMGGLVLLPKEFFEDSGIAVADMYARGMVDAGALNVDYILLHGDERDTDDNISHWTVGGGATNTPTSKGKTRLLVLDGLRRMAEAGTSMTSDLAAVDPISWGTTLGKLMGRRGDMGLVPQESVLIPDAGGIYEINDISSYQSVADVGQTATLLTGMVGTLKGIPVVAPTEWDKSLATVKIAAANDGVEATGSKTQVLRVRREGIKIGRRRGFEVLLEKVPGVDGFVGTGTIRIDMQQMQAKMVALGYNRAAVV